MKRITREEEIKYLRKLPIVTKYLSQIPKLTFKPITREIFIDLEYDGLPYEIHKPKQSQWLYAELKLSPKDKFGLRNNIPECIEKFNLFDIGLKNMYKLHLIDFIDYNNGRVYIVKWR
jgi:hypothetical protein